MANFSIKRKRQKEQLDHASAVNKALERYKERQQACDVRFKDSVQKKYGIKLNRKDIRLLKETIWIKSGVEGTGSFIVDDQNNFVRVIYIYGHKMAVFGQFVSELGDLDSPGRITQVLLYSVLDEQEYTFKLLKYIK